MKVGLIGLGQCGGRIADFMLYCDRWSRFPKYVSFALAVNSARADLSGLKTIKKVDQILVGQRIVKGHGVGGRRELGRKVLKDGIDIVMFRVAEHVEKNDLDSFLVIVGLGGGTGSGGAPEIISKLRMLYDEPICVIGVLPSEDEGELMAVNAQKCLLEINTMVDGIILFDNHKWCDPKLNIEENYANMNILLVRPIPILLGASEAKGSQVGNKVVGVADVVNSWEKLSYLGYSESGIASRMERMINVLRNLGSIRELGVSTRCYNLIQNAATIRLTGECDIRKATKALMIVAGPPRELSMEAFLSARSWLETSILTSEVRGGDFPLKGYDSVAGVVMLSGYREIPRLSLTLPT